MRVALLFCKPDDAFLRLSAQAFSIHQRYPPMGLVSVASTVQRHFETALFDQFVDGHTDKQIVDAVDAFQPGIVGVSCTSLNIGRSSAIARELRRRAPGRVVVAGGVHPSLLPRATASSGAFDAVVAGEGEDLLLKVCTRLEQTGRLEEIGPGLWLSGLRKCGVAMLDDLSSISIDRSLIDGKDYEERGSLVGQGPCKTVQQSRGCPSACRFCSKPDHARRYRLRPIERVLNELDLLKERYSVRSVVFREDNFTAVPERVRELCRAIVERHGDSIEWECESRVDLDPRLLEDMARAGCRGVWSGVETTSLRWQEWLGKTCVPQTTETFYKACHGLGIRTGALFMCGFPGQTEDELERDIDFSLTLPVSWRYFQVMARFPGQRLDPTPWQEYPPVRVSEFVSLCTLPGLDVLGTIVKEREINAMIRVEEAE